MEITYSFKSGTVVKGTVEQILEIAKVLKETVDLSKLPRQTGFYKSESKGLIKISEMNDVHLKNALCKEIRGYYERLARAPYTNLADFRTASTGLATDPVVTDLYREVESRVTKATKK